MIIDDGYGAAHRDPHERALKYGEAPLRTDRFEEAKKQQRLGSYTWTFNVG